MLWIKNEILCMINTAQVDMRDSSSWRWWLFALHHVSKATTIVPQAHKRRGPLAMAPAPGGDHLFFSFYMFFPWRWPEKKFWKTIDASPIRGQVPTKRTQPRRETAKMLSILRKARLKDKEMRILML